MRMRREEPEKDLRAEVGDALLFSEGIDPPLADYLT